MGRVRCWVATCGWVSPGGAGYEVLRLSEDGRGPGEVTELGGYLMMVVARRRGR